MNWFSVDKQGLGKLLASRGKEFVIHELVQNAWDEEVVRVEILTSHQSGKATIDVLDDNPDGFTDLRDSYTLFAESKKKGDAEKRGRFNLGEKLVLAVSSSAEISSTKGTVLFNSSGRTTSRRSRDRGSKVSVVVPMNKASFNAMNDAVLRLIPPGGITTVFNGVELRHREPLAEFEASLPTEIADSQGYMRRTIRKTKVLVYEPREGEKASIYEMGIPVVETGDRWHVNVMQKVPLNTDRDNVTPAYLRQVRTMVVNAMVESLSESDVSETWVKEACKDKDIKSGVIQQVVAKRFGDNAVAYDPSDIEANRISSSQGRHVIGGRSLSAEEWKNLKRANEEMPHNAVGKASGVVTPSPKPFVEDGIPLKTLDQWGREHYWLSDFIEYVGERCIGRKVEVQFADDKAWHCNACYGNGKMQINCATVDVSAGASRENLDLIIHELAHEYGGHLSEGFDKGLSKVGAKMVELALGEPHLFFRA